MSPYCTASQCYTASCMWSDEVREGNETEEKVTQIRKKGEERIRGALDL